MHDHLSMWDKLLSLSLLGVFLKFFQEDMRRQKSEDIMI
jgi:hypothetical protein